MVFSSLPPNWNQMDQTHHHHGVGGGEARQLPPPSGSSVAPPPAPASDGRPTVSMAEKARLVKLPAPEAALKCPRCESTNTKFCYFNNYSLSQPRHFCKTCRRYWTRGGALRNVPVGGGYRRNNRSKSKSSSAATPAAAGGGSSSSSSAMVTASAAAGAAHHQQANLNYNNPPQAPHHLSPFMAAASHHHDLGSFNAFDFAGVLPIDGGGSTDFRAPIDGLDQWRIQQYSLQFPSMVCGHEAAAGSAAELPVPGMLYPFDRADAGELDVFGLGAGLKASSSGHMTQLAGSHVKMEDFSHSQAAGFINLNARQYLGGGGGGGLVGTGVDYHHYCNGVAGSGAGAGGGGWLPDLSGFNSSS